jgi:hypothetical protein
MKKNMGGVSLFLFQFFSRSRHDKLLVIPCFKLSKEKNFFLVVFLGPFGRKLSNKRRKKKLRS